MHPFSWSRGEILTATALGIAAILLGALAVGGTGFWAGYQASRMGGQTVLVGATPTPTTVRAQCANPWADQVVSYTRGPNSVSANPEAALGRPQPGRDTTYKNIVSMGRGGVIVLRMAEPILNGPGKDLRVYEATHLPYPLEYAQVFASQDGVQWTLLGTADNSQRCNCDMNISELDLGLLPSARFVRIVDTTNSSSGPDFDVNAVEALYCGGGPQCRDGVDNDADTNVDLDDPGCQNPEDDDEADAVCSDTKDNDNDGRVDIADPACHSDRKVENLVSYQPLHTSEVDVACSDKADNDGDGKIDEADPGCHTDGNPTAAATYDPADDDERDSTPAPTFSPSPASTFDPGGVQEID